jgi:dTDP-4-dehydrorhamnose 3,5-epimerase-like enzyme
MLTPDTIIPTEKIVTVPRTPFVDDRGEILNLVDVALGSVSIITSFKGSIRANHYHKTDFHYCWLQSGSLDYYHRPVGSEELEKFQIRPGEIFYTPPMYEHVMHFTSDSVFLCFAKNNREMENYEEDTVRISPLNLF